MGTPYEKVQKAFHTKFQVKNELPYGLEEQFFINALGDFAVDLYDLDYDESTYDIDQTLTLSEINLLGLLMYKHYLGRDRDKIMKLNNIVGRDIKLTGMSDSKFAVNSAYKDIEKEIFRLADKLKNTNFE